MTNETSAIHSSDQKPIPFGMRLKTARESMGMERKDVADQLRLNEKVIIMMEKDRYPVDLPVTFIRGYLRAYGKLMEIPDHEVKKAIEPIKQKQPAFQQHSQMVNKAMPTPVTSSNYLMQILTYLILLTLFGLVGTWWYTHNTQPQTHEASTALPSVPDSVNPTMFVQPIVSHPHTSITQSSPAPTSTNPSSVSNTNQLASPPTVTPPKAENSPKAMEKTPTRMDNKPIIELPSPLGSNVIQSRGKSPKKIDRAAEEEDYADERDNIDYANDL